MPKKANKLVRKQVSVQVKEVNEEDRSIDFVITDETVDSYGDIVRASGGDFERFLKNPVMPWAHNYRELPVGKWEKIWKEGKQIIGRAVFAGLGQLHEKAETVFRLYRDGFLSAVSIGFRSIEYKIMESGGYEFLKWQLLEASPVLIPANENALKRAVTKGLIESEDEIKDFFDVDDIEDRTNKEIKNVKKEIEEEQKNEDDENKTDKNNKLERLADLIAGRHSELKAYRKLLKDLSEALDVDRTEDELKTIAEVANAVMKKLTEKPAVNQPVKTERTLVKDDSLAVQATVASLAKILFPNNPK